MPLLRGHHLICLHFYNGEGYDETFIDNMRGILKCAETEEITISSGADDICRCCPYLKESRCSHTESSDEEIRDMDTQALMLLNLSAGDNVKWDSLRHTISNIFSVWHSSYCIECKWRGACEKNAFFRTLLKQS